MKLMTKAIENKLPELYSQENEKDPVCKLKFFTPDSSFTWYVTEGRKEDNGDWLFFGKVVSHLCPEGELGYTMLSQITSIRGSLGLPVERDMYFSDTPLSECK